jgi:Domain of unknown function (DUF4126)
MTLAQSLGLAYASGISPYATMTLVGLMSRAGWIGTLPGALGFLSQPVVLSLVGVLAVVEFIATLAPGVASAWETVHTVIRPPAAAALAVATAWHADPAIIAAAGVLGGGLAFATHATKLGLRVAVDASPEPITNGAMNLTEYAVLGSLSYFIWQHPMASLVFALLLLIATILLLRLMWRWMKRMLARFMPPPSAPPGNVV